MTLWGFGVRTQAAIISQIFPISGFCDDDGKPLVKWGKSRKDRNKRTKRHLGLRRFTKALGLAPTERSSGDKESKSIVGGSDFCRKAFWLWVFSRLEPLRARSKHEPCQHLGNLLDVGKAKKQRVNLLRNQIAAKAAKLLFYELIEAVNQDQMADIQTEN
ncbi:MAG: hypothetical protein WCO45_03925 [Pseudanabaena sp. ELA607]